jgi:protein arginine N-methyltransferase 5
VQQIELATSLFVRNQKNFPVLSKRHQSTVKQFMKMQAGIVLKPRHQSSNVIDHMKYVAEYLFKNHDETLDEEEKIEVPFRNYIQSPLQPLADNLESATYETFENDAIKYELYEQSLLKAFIDKRDTGRFRQTQKCLGPQYQKFQGENDADSQMQIDSSEADKDSEIVVLYFGAGRGPLIRTALNAAKKADVYDRVKVIALDKNPNAIVTLRNMIRDEKLQDKVTLFAGDMRKVDIKDLQGDILMSELLGSFGDNELSPECLIPTEKFLKKGGIYLPWSYSNMVIPISSQMIWNEVLLFAQQGISGRVPYSQQLYPFELPYVVKIYNATFPCGDTT